MTIALTPGPSTEFLENYPGNGPWNGKHVGYFLAAGDGCVFPSFAAHRGPANTTMKARWVYFTSAYKTTKKPNYLESPVFDVFAFRTNLGDSDIISSYSRFFFLFLHYLLSPVFYIDLLQKHRRREIPWSLLIYSFLCFLYFFELPSSLRSMSGYKMSLSLVSTHSDIN